MILFITTLDLPTSDNHCYGQSGKIRFMYTEAKKWKEMAQLVAKSSWHNDVVERPIHAKIKFYLKRDRDVMGSCKLLFDTFQGIIYKNDSQFKSVHLYKYVDKEKPRVEIMFYEKETEGGKEKSSKVISKKTKKTKK